MNKGPGDAALFVANLIRSKVDPDGSDISYDEWCRIYEICDNEGLSQDSVCEETAADIWREVRGTKVEFYRMWDDHTWNTEVAVVPASAGNSEDDAVAWYRQMLEKAAHPKVTERLVQIGVFSWNPID